MTQKKDLNFIIQKRRRYQFDLSYFNKITKGGVPSKTLNIALAGTGVGKSLFMCHCAQCLFGTRFECIVYYFRNG